MAREEAPARAEWFVRDREGLHGPFTAAELRTRARGGELGPDDHVRRGEDGPWTKASAVQGLFARPAAAREVFVSYSHRDKAAVDGLVHCLEARGLRCWIAPRDILPGANWGEAIIRGIESCRVFVLVLSSHSNTSQQILQEVERAVSKGLIVVPLRIQDVPVSPQLELYVGARHWLDAFTSTLEEHAEELAEVLRRILASPTTPAAPRPGHARAPAAPVAVQPAAPTPAEPPSRRWLAWAGASTVIVAAFLAWTRLDRSQAQGAEGVAPASTPHEPERAPAAAPDVEPASPARPAAKSAAPADAAPAPVKAAEPALTAHERAPAPPPDPRAERFEQIASEALEQAQSPTDLARTAQTWKQVSRAYGDLRAPGAEQAARLASVSEALVAAAARALERPGSEETLPARLDALASWVDEAGCEVLAPLAERLFGPCLEELRSSLGRPAGLAELAPLARDLSVLAARPLCGHPRPAQIDELTAGCVAALRTQRPATPTAVEALRWLLVVDGFAQGLPDGPVRDALLADHADTLTPVRACADEETLQGALDAYGALATLEEPGRFVLLAGPVVEACGAAEAAITELLLEPEDLAGLGGNGRRFEAFARRLGATSLLDGARPGRLRAWAAQLASTLEQRLVEGTNASLAEIERALDSRDWRRAERLARELEKRAQKGSRGYWLARVALGRTLLAEGKRADLTPAVHLFKEVVQGTEGREGLEEPLARAACGWARASLGLASDSLREAQGAGRDIKRLRTEESQFVGAIKSANAALSIATPLLPDEAQVLWEELKALDLSWEREIEPLLRGSR